jgi:hypothetical protein
MQQNTNSPSNQGNISRNPFINSTEQQSSNSNTKIPSPPGFQSTDHQSQNSQFPSIVPYSTPAANSNFNTSNTSSIPNPFFIPFHFQNQSISSPADVSNQSYFAPIFSSNRNNNNNSSASSPLLPFPSFNNFTSSSSLNNNPIFTQQNYSSSSDSAVYLLILISFKFFLNIIN